MTRALFVAEALKYLGFPSCSYFGPNKGMGPADGFDCSGFVVFLLQKVGISTLTNLRHTNELFDRFGVFVHKEARACGDLVFFSRNGLVPTHVGILVARDAFIHSSGRRNKIIEICNLVFEAIHGSGKGSIYLENPIGFKRLAIPNGRYQKILD